MEKDGGACCGQWWASVGPTQVRPRWAGQARRLLIGGDLLRWLAVVAFMFLWGGNRVLAKHDVHWERGANQLKALRLLDDPPPAMPSSTRRFNTSINRNTKRGSNGRLVHRPHLVSSSRHDPRL